MSPPPDWRAERPGLLCSPLHRSVLPWLQRLTDSEFPSLAALNGLGLGRILFVPALLHAAGAAVYERRIFERGEVATRSGSWHDLFNALAWLSFPRTKTAINRLHMAELSRRHRAGERGHLRDQATLFDEGGMVVACSEPRLAQMLRDFAWRPLFVGRRAEVLQHMRFFVFGHALLEKGLRPYKSMAARAFTVSVAGELLRRPLVEQLAALDGASADAAERGVLFASREAVTPVPVMGIPGWSHDNESAGYYDDPEVFRPRNERSPPAQ
jgi:hypothetical protein